MFAIQRFTTSSPLTREKLQASIRDLFIKMASEMSSKDPDATRDPKIALQLDPSDDITKAKLLMILGKAHGKKNEFDAAMEYYEQALKLENSNDYQRAYLYSCIGDTILRKNGDVDQAITNFNEGLKLQPDNAELTADLHLGLSKAYRLKAKPKNT
jgi:tetratricopeptide (TPR) repeat protein